MEYGSLRYRGKVTRPGFLWLPRVLPVSSGRVERILRSPLVPPQRQRYKKINSQTQHLQVVMFGWLALRFMELILKILEFLSWVFTLLVCSPLQSKFFTPKRPPTLLPDAPSKQPKTARNKDCERREGARAVHYSAVASGVGVLVGGRIHGQLIESSPTKDYD